MVNCSSMVKRWQTDGFMLVDDGWFVVSIQWWRFEADGIYYQVLWTDGSVMVTRWVVRVLDQNQRSSTIIDSARPCVSVQYLDGVRILTNPRIQTYMQTRTYIRTDIHKNIDLYIWIRTSVYACKLWLFTVDGNLPKSKLGLCLWSPA